MEKLKKVQLPLLMLLLILLIILFLRYQDVIKKNSVLKSKLSEKMLVSRRVPNTMVATSNKNAENPQHEDICQMESAKAITHADVAETDTNAIAEQQLSPKAIVENIVPFEEQQIDYEWATTIETAVSDVFLTSELLEGFTLENIECRSTICEVRMPRAQEDTFHQSVLVLFALEEMGIKHHSLKLGSDTIDETVIFYFSKQD